MNGIAAIRATSVPILMYHQVTSTPDPAFRQYTVTPKTFAAQMRWLLAAGFRGVSLADLLAVPSMPHREARKPVVITFDDGFRDAVEHAVPVLLSCGFTATFYLVGGLMGGTSRWLAGEIGRVFPLIDWQTARELADAGFHIGSHTMTHPRLAGLQSSECQRELRNSKDVLETNLGRAVQHLAYPYGSYNRDVAAAAAEAGYTTACTVRHGHAALRDAPFELRRLWVPIAEPETLPGFVFRVHTARRPQDWLNHGARAAWKRLRRRGYSKPEPTDPIGSPADVA